MARTAGGGPVKDHVFHATAAHCGGAVFAHHPTHCFQKVGFAAPIRANHTGQPVVDHQIGWVHKAFEAVQPQLGKAQIPVPFDSDKALIVWSGAAKVNALHVYHRRMMGYGWAYPHNLGLSAEGLHPP